MEKKILNSGKLEFIEITQHKIKVIQMENSQG